MFYPQRKIGLVLNDCYLKKEKEKEKEKETLFFLLPIKICLKSSVLPIPFCIEIIIKKDNGEKEGHHYDIKTQRYVI